jgi:hypothetical protein
VAYENSQGITFSFAGQVFTATSISVTRSRGEQDVSTTDIASGNFRRIRTKKINDVQVKVDWIGGNVPPVKSTVAYSWSVSGTDIGANQFTNNKAICTGLSITGAAGDLIKGSATFKLSQD